MPNDHALQELDLLEGDVVDKDQIDEVDTAPEPPLGADPPPPSRPRRMLIGLSVLVLGLVGLSGFLGWQQYNAHQITNAAEAAQRTADGYAVTLTSVDTNDLDGNFQAVLDGSTGSFRDIYAQSSTQLRQLLIDHKATGHGVVIDSAVKSATRDEVVVLLFVDQTVTNTESPDPRIDRSRIVMTMRNVDGQWKAENIDLH